MNIPPVVLVLLVVNGLLFALGQSDPQALVTWLGLWPPGGDVSAFQPWQLLSYGFVHLGLLHLALNMYALWLFGTPLEHALGTRRFLILYLGCVVGAALLHLLVQQLMMVQGVPAAPVIGASGGTFGVLMAFAYLYPDSRLYLLFPPMPVKAKWFVVGYGVIELLFGVTGTANGIAHFAHLGGMLFGYLLLRYWRSHPPGYR